MGETSIRERCNNIHKIFEVWYTKERDYFENLDLDGRRILKRIMNKHGTVMDVAFICLGLMTFDGILWAW